ncbi:hypothetical protein OTU49_002147 [Cherax quadricarinatus]|uniref:DUF7789 domain-containing protein n=1 Tax=Cherax quadricarinatus TaxID=27406 RepID=A0AAW0XQC6_CHEQU|nr:uncharacterized protein LOC128690579 isoform X1 [Cherax quadricarinatus]
MEGLGGSYLYPNDSRQQQPEWGRDRPITFEDLGIPRFQATRSTVLGNIRTCQSLQFLEWILLIGGLLSTFLTIGLAIYRLFFLSPGASDYVFAMLLIFHSAFCIIYILDGVFREQAFEIVAFVASCVILIVYVVINFVKDSTSTSDIFKLVRLVFTLVFGTSMGGVGLVLGYSYWQSQNLIFRTVGADSTIQTMCRSLFTAITLILFDTQIVGSVVIMALHHGITQLQLEEVLTLSMGFPMLTAWGVIAYLALRLESGYFFSVAMMLSPCHIAFALLAIIQTALNHGSSLIAECRYAASAGSIIVHILLIVLMVKCYRNFGLGLKEKVYPSQSDRNTTQTSGLVQ